MKLCIFQGAGRQLDDIPRDTSDSNSPFFKLPLPDDEEEDYYDDVVVVSAGDDDDEGQYDDDFGNS